MAKGQEALTSFYTRHKVPLISLGLLLLLILNHAATTSFPSLRLIVWAFFAGITISALGVLFLLLLTTEPTDLNSSETLRSLPSLAFTKPARWSAETTANKFTLAPSAPLPPLPPPPPLYPPSPAISSSLETLLSHIQRDFITSWYSNVSSASTFPDEVSKLIRHALTSALSRTGNLDLSDLLVARLSPIITAHIHDFSAAEKAVRGKNLNKHLTESEELDNAIAGKYRDGKLHLAAGTGYSDMALAGQDYLRKVVEKILPLVLPEKEIGSRVVGVIVREIVACAILSPILAMLAVPDTWNQLVVALGKSYLQDRKSVKKFRAALEKHATPQKSDYGGHRPPAERGHQLVRLSPSDDERTFERFIRSIRLCNNLSDARRFRNEITAQLKRDEKMDISALQLDSAKWQVYIRRLETGKRLIDQKVAVLSGEPVPAGPVATVQASSGMTRSVSETVLSGRKWTSSRLESASLEHVLQDSAGLSYFMEYMDRQNSLPLVQFWLVVSGIRNPLEDDIASDDENSATISAASFPPWTSSDRADIQQIHGAYLSSPKSTIHLSDRSRRAIKEFLKYGDKASQKYYIRARSAILRAQTAVYEEMNQKYFPGFRASDLYYKYLATDESGGASSARQSLDVPSGNSGSANGSPNFDNDEDWDTDPLAGSVGSLKEETMLSRKIRGARDRNHSLLPDRGVVEAVEAALNDIIDTPAISDPNSRANSPRPSIDFDRDTSEFGPGLVDRRLSARPTNNKSSSLAALGLINPEVRETVFETELFPEDNHDPEAEVLEDYNSDIEANDDGDDEIQFAAPGDLGLAETILTLTYEISKLMSQEAVVDSLYRKAELTNNTPELRILRKSKASLQREIRRKEMQKQQYIIQESDNSLYGRSAVSIKKTVVDSEGGQEYALYIVEVSRQGGEQLPAAQWAVARRYSEFFQLHQTLKRFESVRDLEFPRRRVVMKLQKDFLEKRRRALDLYLKSLLQIPEVCRSREFRAFLSCQTGPAQRHATTTTSSSTSPSRPTTSGKKTAPASLSSISSNKTLMSHLYTSLADGMEDILGNLPIPPLPLLDQLTPQPPTSSSTLPEEKFSAAAVAEAEAELAAFEDKDVEPFVKPICDLFMEVFELNRKSNWLRGRAVVVVLHQLLGGTIERKVKEYIASAVDEATVLRYIKWVGDIVWPGGELRRKEEAGGGSGGAGAAGERTEKEMNKTRNEAGAVLASLIPELSASVVGRQNAQSASRRLSATLNNRRLNTSLLYEILDEVVNVVFGIPPQVPIHPSLPAAAMNTGMTGSGTLP